MGWLRSIVSVSLLFAATPALSGDGVVEINQTCAEAVGGCFCGDAQFLPVTITGCAGRSYRLTGDLSLKNPTTTGIVVSFADVSIDLGEFTIRGPNQCDGTFGGCTVSSTGIGVEVNADRVRITNGTIIGTGGEGILAAAGNDHQVRRVTVAHSGRDGVYVGGSAVIEDVTARLNARTGISVGTASRVVDCFASDNARNGVLAGIASVVDRCTAHSNVDTGIEVSAGSVVRNSIARENEQHGIVDTAPLSVPYLGGVIQGCVASGNARYAISANRGLVVDNSISDNNDGLFIGPGSAYRDNAITSNIGATVNNFGGANLGGNHCTDAADTVVPCP